MDPQGQEPESPAPQLVPDGNQTMAGPGEVETPEAAPASPDAGVVEDVPVAASPLGEESAPPAGESANAGGGAGIQPDVPVAPGVKPKSLLSLKELDEKIRALGGPEAVAKRVADKTLSVENQRLLLQRLFVERAGFDALNAFACTSQNHSDFLEWLLNDTEMLALYVTGGVPGGRGDFEAAKSAEKRSELHKRALTQLMELCRVYGDDIRPMKEGDSRTEVDRVVYRKMMVSAALGMGPHTHLWESNGHRPADPVKRYGIIKTFRQNHEHYHFYKDLFDALPVETMRWVFENRIADEELPWLVNYTLTFNNGQPLEEGKRLDAYSYTYTDSKEGVHWRWDNPTFYNQHDIENEAMTLSRPANPNYIPQKVEGGWQKLYKFTYEDENFPNKEKTDPYYLSYDILTEEQIKQKKDAGVLPIRLWMVFQRGGVCGAIAKTYENLNGASGLPSTVCGQPGHAATAKLTLQENKATGKMEPKWGIQNNSHGDPGSGWNVLQVPEANHRLCGWDEVHDGPGTADDANHKYSHVDTKNDMYMRRGGGSYILLAQEMLEDMDAYTRTFMLRALADSCTDDADKEAVIDVALGVQGGNQDVELAKVALMDKRNASDAEWIEFAETVCSELKWQPIPMHSMMKLIIQKGGDQLRGPIEAMRICALQRAMAVTEADYNQKDECFWTARFLTRRNDGKAATFSFSGEDAGKIKLGIQFKDMKTPWSFSVDGGKTWIDAPQNSIEAQLTPDQLDRITVENDIKVKVGEVPESGIVTIDITEGKAPERWYANDNDNRFYTKEIAQDPKTAANYDAKVNGKWVPLSEAQPFEGAQTVEIRTGRMGTSVASTGTVEAAFTDNTADGERHIPHEELVVNSYSSAHGGDGNARTAIDGWVPPQSQDGEFWHSDYGTEDNPWITIDLGRERDVTALELWRRSNGGNGVPNGDLTVYVAPDDGVPMEDKPNAHKPADGAFREVKTFRVGGDGVHWENGRVRLDFDEPVSARYIKVMRPGSGLLFSCAELDFFEVSRPEPPAPDPDPDPNPPAPDPDPNPDPDPAPDPDPNPNPDHGSDHNQDSIPGPDATPDGNDGQGDQNGGGQSDRNPNGPSQQGSVLPHTGDPIGALGSAIVAGTAALMAGCRIRRRR